VSRLLNISEEGLKEKDMRLLIIGLHKNKDMENTFYRHLAMQDFKSITVVAVKVLALTNKLSLYCPEIVHKSLLSLY
jgi:hypothetical protein